MIIIIISVERNSLDLIIVSLILIIYQQRQSAPEMVGGWSLTQSNIVGGKCNQVRINVKVVERKILLQ